MSDADLIAALGARGMGKSAWVTQRLAKTKPKRLLIWDLMREHKSRLVTADLKEVFKAMSKKTFSIAFHPTVGNRDRLAYEFDQLCQATMDDDAQNLTFLVEELAFVTKPGHAPDGWRELTLLGRHKHVEVIGTAQRPASIDKDFLGNCTIVHSARLPYEDDARLVSKTLGVPYQDLMSLKPLEWIERSGTDEKAVRGMLKFARSSGPKPQDPNLQPPP